MDRGAWWATVHGVTKELDLTEHAHSRILPKDFPDPGIKLGSPTLQADSSPSEPPGKALIRRLVIKGQKVSEVRRSKDQVPKLVC